ASLAEDPGKACTGVEPRQAEPINRAVPPHQGRCLQVAIQSVIFDPERHDILLVPRRTCGAEYAATPVAVSVSRFVVASRRDEADGQPPSPDGGWLPSPSPSGDF